MWVLLKPGGKRGSADGIPEATDGDVRNDVFLSHAGQQKRGFVDHLAASFSRRYSNIRVFLDEISLQVGRNPAQAMDKAMEDCPVAVIVLSPEFVRKKHPMYELHYLLERRRRGQAALVPVLYSLPFQDTQDMMAAYKQQPWVGGGRRPERAVLEQWAADVRELLRTATAVRADQFRGEAGMVEGVVDVVIPYLRAAGRAVVRHPEVQLPDHTVGIEPRREALVAQLRQHGMVLLHGMGGIGKTTLANATYDLLSKSEFAADCCVRMSFHADMRAEGILEQQKVVLQLLGWVGLLVDTQQGRRALAEALKGKKVLLLVDNVWGSQLLDALPSDILIILANSQSMVLVTSRDATAGEDFQPSPLVQEMRALSHPDALRLFTMLAFGAGASSVPADKAAIVENLLLRCGGLPFAVEVSAKQLKEKPIGDWRRWETQLQRAFESQKAKQPDQEKTLRAALQVSYDFLAPAEREFLLDVAFLVRYCGRSSRAIQRDYRRDTVPNVVGSQQLVGFSWQLLQAYCGHELDVLLSRGLVQRVDSGDHLYGHEANLHDSVMALCFGHLLSDSLTDTRGRDELISSTVQDPRCMHLAAQHQSSIRAGEMFEWLAASQLEGAPATNLFRCRVLWLDQVRWLHGWKEGSWMLLRDAAAGFHELRMLHYSAATWAPQQLPDALLANFSKLVVLHLRAIDNKELSLQGLRQLKKFTLEHASHLQSVDGWSDLSRLEELQITDCDKLELRGMDGMAYLRSFKLESAGSLLDLKNLSGLEILEVLQLWGCSRLTSLQGLDALACLEELRLARCGALVELQDLRQLPLLARFSISTCKELTSLHGISACQQLQELYINSCEALCQAPDLKQLASLSKVKILNSHAVGPSLDLGGATSLKELLVLACNGLQRLPGLEQLEQLTSLHLASCNALVAIPDLGALRGLKELLVSDCDALALLPPLDQLSAVTRLHLDTCTSLTSPAGLSGLRSLEKLRITKCHRVQQLPGLGGAAALTSIHIVSCNSLRSLASLDGLARLQVLELSSCYGLQQLDGFGSLVALQKLKLHWCRALTALPDLTGMPGLTDLDIYKCDLLPQLPGLGSLPALRLVELRGCQALTSVPDLRGLPSLQEFSIIWGYKLLQLPGLGQVTALTKLALLHCPLLEEVPDLGGLSELRHLHLEGLHCLRDLPWLPRLAALHTLFIKKCSNVAALPDIRGLSRLRRLDVDECEKLQRIPGLRALGPSVVYNVWDCPALQLDDHQ